MAPIFTPPRSVSAPEVEASLAQHIQQDIPVLSFTPEQTKEVFDVARNSIELLTTVLSSSPQQDALEVLFILHHFLLNLNFNADALFLKFFNVIIGPFGSA